MNLKTHNQTTKTIANILDIKANKKESTLQQKYIT